jgi:ubiquinone/menaquinone biosynthesis C-methylase UbiE
MKRLLRNVKRILDPYLGKYFDRLIWRFRHLLITNWQDGYLDEECLDHPHRQLIIDAISKREEINSILELGTGSGINLIKLSKHFPSINYSGIDINKKAIEIGIKYLEENNLSNIRINVGDISGINNMESDSVDILMTDAVLMYLNPKDLKYLLVEMLRISKKGFILCEQMSPGGLYVDHWRHDYEEVLNKLNGIRHYNLKKITKEYWNDDWIKYGYLIEVYKN